MNAETYLQSYKAYFWQWEESGRVIAIPGSFTIAYRDYIAEVLGELVPQGFPSFGALLLAVAATNPNGRASLDELDRLFQDLPQNPAWVYDWPAALGFLQLLGQLPEFYKSGEKRVLLLQTIFNKSHNHLSVSRSKAILEQLSDVGYSFSRVGEIRLDPKQAHDDIRALEILGKRYPTVESILEAMAGTPKIPEEEIELEPTHGPEPVDFIEQLIREPETFKAAALVRGLWSRLNIPYHNNVPSQQPFGGVADITNKGEFDKLLVSEYAHDDVVFMSRLANQEALYLNREIPPSDNNRERLILIDTTLHNWGTVKTLAFATALAIANHPKTDIKCSVMVLGQRVVEVDIETIHGVIEGQNQLDTNLHAGRGLTEFFKETDVREKEVFWVTHRDALRPPEVQQVLHDPNTKIDYWIHPTADGALDIFKQANRSRRHVQSLILPLQDMWDEMRPQDSPRKKKKTPPKKKTESRYPLLFPHPGNSRQVLLSEEGELFKITRDRNIFMRYDVGNEPGEKGWELLREDLPSASGKFAVGIDVQLGNRVLCWYNQQRQLMLLHLSGGTDYISTPSYKMYYGDFFFGGVMFYHLDHMRFTGIDREGNEVDPRLPRQTIIDRLAEHRKKELEAIRQNTSHGSVLRNIKRIAVDENSVLFFNQHALVGGAMNQLHWGHAAPGDHPVYATRYEGDVYQFSDGSKITLLRDGMSIWKSSNTEIPKFYVPTLLDRPLGMATEDVFAGDDYFFKESRYRVTLLEYGPSRLETIKHLKIHLEIGLREAKEMADTAPQVLTSSFSKEKARKLVDDINQAGSKAKMEPVTEEMPRIETTEFSRRYIQPFIARIRSHGH